MEALTYEEGKFYLFEEKMGLSRQPIIKNKREVILLLLRWMHHCKATRTGRRLSGGHEILSSTTQALVVDGGHIHWKDVDDQTDLTGADTNFGDCQHVGEFDYQEVRRFDALTSYIKIYNEQSFILTDGSTITDFHLTTRGARRLAKELYAQAEKSREKALIDGREIYKTIDGLRRVNIGEYSYALEVPTGEKNQTNVGDSHDSYSSEDPVLHAWLQAAKEIGVPARYSWHGIMSALGDHASVAPPWKPRERNYKRA